MVEDRAEAMLVVAAALMRRGEVLVQQRPAGKSMGGLWEFPGGKVEPGEAPDAALARELAEELGIDADPATMEPLAFATGTIGRRPLVLLLYRVPDWTGEPRALEAPALRWASPEALRTLPMPPADAPLVEALARAAPDTG